MKRRLFLIIKHILGIDTRSNFERALENGLTVGENINIQDDVKFDLSHCWLISLGNDVTIAPNVIILAHDASTKRALGYTKIGKTIIGNNVFIGANTVVLPGVNIGNDVIIGAGSVVSKNIPNNSVVVGNPVRVIKSYDKYMEEQNNLFNLFPKFDSSYTVHQNISDEKKKEMKDLLEHSDGFVM